MYFLVKNDRAAEPHLAAGPTVSNGGGVSFVFQSGKQNYVRFQYRRSQLASDHT
jgi:hypothetical protein